MGGGTTAKQLLLLLLPLLLLPLRPLLPLLLLLLLLLSLLLLPLLSLRPLTAPPSLPTRVNGTLLPSADWAYSLCQPYCPGSCCPSRPSTWVMMRGRRDTATHEVDLGVAWIQWIQVKTQ